MSNVWYLYVQYFLFVPVYITSNWSKILNTRSKSEEIWQVSGGLLVYCQDVEVTAETYPHPL